MAADLHIHVFEGLTEQDLADFFSNTMGSKYFRGLFRPQISSARHDAASDKISKTPNIWIGEVSWLKASIADDDETYIPNTVGQIYDLIGERLPVIDEQLISDILAVFKLPNTTTYDLAKPEVVEKFLLEHKGKCVFTVSW